MNFLFPFFMMGLAAVAIPIMLHFRRQPPQKVVPFSSLMFLEQTPVPPRTRRKLEDWLLLLLRCLALILIALMFARPFLKKPGVLVASEETSWCILVDTSASMKRDGAWAAAKARLAEALGAIHERDSVMLATFDREPKELTGFDAWQTLPEGGRKAELSRQMESLSPTWFGTDLGAALRYAASRFQGSHAEGARRQRIVLISDLQEGAALEALHSESWPEKVTVTALVVDAPWKDNLTLSAASAWIVETASSVPTANSAKPAAAAETQTRVRITSARDATREKFSLSWADGGEALQATIPAGGTRILPAPARLEKFQETDGVLKLSGDSLEFDNQLYTARPRARELKVLCLGQPAVLSRTSTSSPLFYLVRALHPSPTLKPVVVEKEPAQLTTDDLATATMVVALGDLPEAQTAMLKSWTESGGSLVQVALSGDRGNLLQAVADAGEVKVSEAASKEALLQDLRFDHAILRSFAEAGVRDFTRIRFWKHRVVALPKEASEKAVILARFDDQTPAWIELPSGKGKMLYLAAGWAPGDSQLAVSSKFVPLLYGMLDWAAGGTAAATGFVVGDPIPAAVGNWQGSVPVVAPDETTTTWDVGSASAYTGTTLPGFYRIGPGESAITVALNLAPAEGRTAPMPVSKLGELGVKLDPALTARAAAASEAELVKLADAQEEQRQKVWKVFLVAALVVLLLETWLAGRREGRSRQPAEMQTA